MSGLLRRIKRSRPAEAGEPTPEGRAAATEGAATTAETPSGAAGTTAGETPATAAAETGPATGAGASATTGSGGSTSSGQETRAGAPASAEGGGSTNTWATSGPETSTGATSDATTTPGETGGVEAAPSAAPTRTRRRLFRRRPKRDPAAVQPAPPVLLADPNVPAGVDPAEAPMRPPAGRRGRLRRRLRYLRRARELMLRDLGGLLYEIHRTGGGSVDAHATVVDAKVQRIAGLDAEAHALETALATPRGEAVVFEPGIGGTCATCGELYGSDARFCANCGNPIGAAAETKPPGAEPDVVSAPQRRAFWRRAARPASPAPAASAPASPSDETAVLGEGAAPGAQPQVPTTTGAQDQPADPAAGRPAGPNAADAPDETPPSGEANLLRDESAGSGDRSAAQPHEQPTAAIDQAAADPYGRPEPEGGDAAATADERAPGEAESGGQAGTDEARPESGGHAGTDEARGEGGSQTGRDETRAEGGGQTGPGEARAEGDAPGNPNSGVRNGRPDEQQRPPGFSSGDPLVSRDRS